MLIYCQSEISYEGYVRPKRIYKGDTFQAEFRLSNAKSKEFRPPNFGGLEVVGGPYYASEQTLNKGRISFSESRTYELVARKTGTYTIGSTSVVVDRRRIESTPITVTILERDLSRQNEEADLFVVAEPDIYEAFIGQQIILRYKLYTRQNVRRPNRREEEQYPGFYAQPIRSGNYRSQIEVYNGKQYRTDVFYTIALFPQQTGLLTIPSTNVQVGVELEEDSGGISFFQNARRVDLQTQPVDITVKPLPTNTSESFTGGVGSFRIEYFMRNNQITTDDALSFRVSIVGDGDIKRVGTPKIEFPEGFEVYDPRVELEETIEQNGRLTGRKIIEYIAVPMLPGDYKLNPSLSYFDPDSIKYISVNSAPFDVRVSQGQNNTSTFVNPTTQNEQAYVEDIRHLKFQTTLHDRNSSFRTSISFWLVYTLPILGLVVFVLLRRYQTNIDQAEVVKKKATKIALQRLKIANQYLIKGENRAFYDEVSKAMIEYVSDKLKVPGSELTKDNVRKRLNELAIQEETIDQFMEIIQHTETALFSGVQQSDELQQVYNESVKILTQIESETKNR